MKTKTKKRTPAVRTIRHRGLILRPDPGTDGYTTGGPDRIRADVYRSDDGDMWIAAVATGDDDCSGEGDTIGGALDDALFNADRELTSSIRSLSAERRRIRKVLEAKP